MKVIVIEDKDGRALLDSLELKKLQCREDVFGRTAFNKKLTERERRAIVSEIHGSFHYHVCRWLQAQGVDVVKR